jgi:hypothetical protein
MNTDQTIIKNKVCLLNLAQILGGASPACTVKGYSRDSFQSFRETYDVFSLQMLSHFDGNRFARTHINDG